MYQEGFTFYFNDLQEYIEIAQYCNRNGLVIVPIGSDENGEKFQIQQPSPISSEQQYSIEYFDLKKWFEKIYTYKEQKYRRLISLNKLDDDGIDGQTKLTALYEEAEEKRKRIQELENLLSTGV